MMISNGLLRGNRLYMYVSHRRQRERGESDRIFDPLTNHPSVEKHSLS